MDINEDVANPAPLGLGGFALSTFILNLVNSGLVSGGSLGIVMPMAIAYGGLAQLLAGMWEFRRNNIFGATAFSSFGAFWIGLASFFFMDWAGIIADTPKEGIAIALIAWGIFTFYATIASLREPTAITWIFITLTILFFLLAWGEFNPTVQKIAGYEGLVVAGIAWYSSAGVLINSMFGKTVLPLGESK
ncbi:MAG: acetate uptake transporter [Candidatus Bipolaricaulota bacterium]